MLNRRDIITTIDTFHKELYSSSNKELNTNIPEWPNQGPENVSK